MFKRNILVLERKEAIKDLAKVLAMLELPYMHPLPVPHHQSSPKVNCWTPQIRVWPRALYLYLFPYCLLTVLSKLEIGILLADLF